MTVMTTLQLPSASFSSLFPMPFIELSAIVICCAQSATADARVPVNAQLWYLGRVASCLPLYAFAWSEGWNLREPSVYEVPASVSDEFRSAAHLYLCILHDIDINESKLCYKYFKNWGETTLRALLKIPFANMWSQSIFSSKTGAVRHLPLNPVGFYFSIQSPILRWMGSILQGACSST